ncbi:MAG: trypsin-like serine protease [Xanthomonadaceae bacterium]|nr:trypsin-like serine protease [Xanthomonadaceae bacterium]
MQSQSRTTRQARLALAMFAAVAATSSIAQQRPATAESLRPSAPAQRIVGGSLTTTVQPWVAALLQNGQQGCGGSLIAPQWVVTAAHCVSGGANPTQVRLGSLYRSSGGQVISISQKIVHPGYSTSNINGGNDIALLKLASPVSGITPISIAASAPGANTAVRLYGWGQTTPQQGGDRGSEQLKQLDTQIIASSNCANYRTGDLCVRGSTSATACYGDSGGPAIVGGALVGATSRAGGNNTTCGPTNAIYTSVVYFKSWISQYVSTTPPGDYSISGTITNSSGAGISGVTVSNGSVTATTSSTGAYTLTGVGNGTYTLTPSLSGYTFSPASRSVTVNGANVTGQDFTGTGSSTGNWQTQSGSLASGGSATVPSSPGYVQGGNGTYQATLSGPSTADFDLYLFKWNGASWTQVAKSDGSTSSESISYNGTAGYYALQVRSYSGSGTYTARYLFP